MKYIDEFRDGEQAKALAHTIAREADPARSYRLMEFCGGHTHAISRYGLEDLLPPSVQMIHGPGCPVCVLPTERINAALWLADHPDVTLCTYGDLLRVPGSKRRSLLQAKAEGADVRMVYSSLDAVALAQTLPDRKVVFFAIGFETTTPPTAVALQQAKSLGLKNFFVCCNHVLTPPAIRAILDAGAAIDGLLGPAHVSTIIGTRPYCPFAEQDGKPLVVTGFEPLDVLAAILMLVRQINRGEATVENQFVRAVTAEGNRKALALMSTVFTIRPDFAWRGLGRLPQSALQLADAYADFDAERHWTLPDEAVADPKGCACPDILRGIKHPRDCRLFGTVCTPDNPVGSCMVSSEGACAAHWTYGRFREGVAP